MKRHILFILFALLTANLSAQSHEIGLSFGGANFIGDIGRTNYVYPTDFAGGLIYKYNLNPRIALRGSYNYIPISGDDSQSENAYRKAAGRSFKNTIHEFAAGVEVNFYDYNIADNRTSYTPYIFAKLAAFSYKSPVEYLGNNNVRLKNSFSYALPVGVGIKGQLIGDIAISFEIGARYSFTDELDYSTPTISDLDFAGNGNDWYVFSGISLVYTFGRPQCYSGLTQ